MAKINSLCEKLECPICLEYLEIPIRQCVIGHSFCTKCIDPNNIHLCPKCRSAILETRNYKLEEWIECLKFPCENKSAGCNYILDKSLMESHKLQCRYRLFKCDDIQFCNWTCNWVGRDLLEHFKSKHSRHTLMEYTKQVSQPYNSTRNITDIQLISAHHQLFWYKHKIDIDKSKAFWAFQLIGLKNQAHYYYYEFEFYLSSQPVRKYKITEYCHCDLDDIEKIFESEKCVAISLNALKTFVDEKQEISFRFRIMKLKKDENTSKSNEVGSNKSAVKYQKPFKGEQ